MQKLYIIKIGGNVIDDSEKLSAFLTAFASIKEKKILVHGGGKLATNIASRLNIDQQIIEGRRVTNAETLEVITMVYAGLINKNIVAQLQANDCNALGVTGADGDLIRAHKRINPKVDYGFVGDIDVVNNNAITALIEKGFTPVFAPITHSGAGQLLNTNADTIATSIAVAMASKNNVQLIFCFEKDGVMVEDKVMKRITNSQFEDLKVDKHITAGMIPKLDNAFKAAKAGIHVTIGNPDIHRIIAGKSGTIVVNE